MVQAALFRPQVAGREVDTRVAVIAAVVGRSVRGTGKAQKSTRRSTRPFIVSANEVGLDVAIVGVVIDHFALRVDGLHEVGRRSLMMFDASLSVRILLNVG